jgi:hypothetical protein
MVVLPLALLSCSDTDSTAPIGEDTMPPGRVEDLAVHRSRGGAFALGWTAPGDDGMEGRASAYSIRYSAAPLAETNWESASVVDSPPAPKPGGETESFPLSGLPAGSWYFGLKSADEVLNWSGLSNIVTATLADPDTIPPNRVNDLTGVSATSTSVTLSWTAPGDDSTWGWASTYDLRYALTAITEETWQGAVRVPDVPPPDSAGTQESFAVTGLQQGTDYFFALKTADEAANSSPLSNVASFATPPDEISPGAVTDLAVAVATTTRVRVTWTAPGDDSGEGQASEYDLRYALTAITEETWDEAIRAEGVPPPHQAGTVESFIVTRLEPEAEYFFALRAADETPNWSELSNIASVSTVSLLRLTFSPDGRGAYHPAWSPDGLRIAFDADWPQRLHNQVYVAPLGGGVPERLTDDPDYAWHPAWSPDGELIAFATHRYGGEDSGLWIMDPVRGAQPFLVARHGDGVFAYRGSWSPDGASIAYHVFDQPGAIVNIYLVPSAGGPSELLLDDSGPNRWPAWSPEGTQIAFSSDRSGNTDIWVMAAGDPVQLTFDPEADAHPAWSPDGNRIAFASTRGGSGEYDIWVMSSTGENPAPLTVDPARDWFPSWSPDGTEIAFESQRTGGSEIWLISTP